MTAHSQSKEQQGGLAGRLAKLFARPEPEDEAARAAIERIAATERRIAEIRKEVQRGVRKREGRFRL